VGTINNSYGDEIQADLEVTNKGSTHGTLILDGEKLEVLAVDGKTFLRASESFWSKHGAPRDAIGEYAKQWVKVSADVIGIDIPKILAPVRLGQQLSQTASSHRITLGPETTIKGIRVGKVTTPQGTLYITTDVPQRIVRIEVNSALTLDSRPQTTARILPALFGARTPPPGQDAYRFDISNMSLPQIENLHEQLQQRVQDLKSSVDSEVRFTLDGDVVLAPCTTFGCTATFRIRNTVFSTGPPANQPITVSITINMTLDGALVRQCFEVKTMLPNDGTTAQCTASYSIPPSRNPTTHIVLATVLAIAQAMAHADIQRITDDLKKDLEKSRSDVSDQIDKLLSQIATRNINDQTTKQTATDGLRRLVGEKVPTMPITDLERKATYEQLIGKFRDVDEKNFIAHLVAAKPDLTGEQIKAFLAHAKKEKDLDRIILLYAYVYKDSPPGLGKLLRDIASDSLATETTEATFTSYKGSLFQLERIAIQKSMVKEIEPPGLWGKGFDILLNDDTYEELKARQKAPTLYEMQGKINTELPEGLPALKKLRFVFKTGVDGFDQKGIEAVNRYTRELVEYGKTKGVEVEVVFWP
jgi:hypothetical protein